MQNRSIAELQRARLVRAAVAVASEHGYEEASATAVSARAGVSRKTFYELFENREDCFIVVLEEFFVHVAAVVGPAYEGDGAWARRLRTTLLALLALLERERETGLLALSYLVGYGPKSPVLRARVLALLQRIIDEGRVQASARHQPSALTAELVVGGVLAVVHARLQTGSERLDALVNPLMWMIVLPYLGAAAAARELTRTVPRRASPPASPARDPLRGLNMRLTYRTGRVLAVIAEEPGRSNMEIGARVDVADQGQISKLLARLAHLGLIENTGAGQIKGRANAWRLTTRGDEVNSAIRRRFALAEHPRAKR